VANYRPPTITRMHSGENERLSRSIVNSPHRLGTALGALSALAYTAANICLRSVATECDPVWVSFVKVVPVAVASWGLTAWSAYRGAKVLPPRRILFALLTTGLIVQLAGNVAFQWSLGQVGLALAVPLCVGMVITGGACLGRILLSEPITRRSALAMLLLVVSVGVLSQGAGAAHRAMSHGSVDVPATLSVLGIAAACVAGLAYSTSGVVIRRVSQRVPVGTVLATISGTGVVVLGGLSLGRLGLEGLLATGSDEMARMLLAGVFNAIAFFALGKSLQLITLVEVNALESSQTALAASAGVILFGEPLSGALVLGAGLTVVGLMMIQRGRRN